MQDQRWSRFVIFVNAYYAVQEAYDAARRAWEKPTDGLEAFCRDANPFLWDEEGSADEALYDGFRAAFDRRFEDDECTAEEGYALAVTWLRTLEGGRYGTALVSSLESTAGPDDFRDACEPIARQLAARAVRLERTPQEEPMTFEELAPKAPSQADIEAVIALLSHGDEAFAQSLRNRLSEDEQRA